MNYNVQKQHDKGKYHAIERLLLLLDANSFREIGGEISNYHSIAGVSSEEYPYDGVITGSGTINGRSVFVFSQDFTIKGGSLGMMHGKKIAHTIEMAVKARRPIIGIYDSGGARIDEGVDSLAGCGELMFQNVIASGIIPQISIVLGPCAGAAAYSPAITDFIFSVDKVGYMFVTGTDVVKSVTGEAYSAHELGGARIHAAKSGVVHFLYKREKACLKDVRRLVDMLPLSCEQRPNAAAQYIAKSLPELDMVIPSKAKQVYDVTEIIKGIFDDGSFLEVQQLFAPQIVVGFCELSGMTVGVVANQPNANGGILDCDASDKAARFVRFCDAFGIPIVTFVDTPGYMPGVNQEHQGIIRHGAKLLYAYSEATAIKITVVLRKAYGGAYIAMGSRHLGADYVYVTPRAEIAVMGADGAVAVKYRKKIAELDESEREQFVKEKSEEYSSRYLNAQMVLRSGYADAIVSPSNLRRRLYDDILRLKDKVGSTATTRKHGNIPL